MREELQQVSSPKKDPSVAMATARKSLSWGSSAYQPLTFFFLRLRKVNRLPSDRTGVLHSTNLSEIWTDYDGDFDTFNLIQAGVVPLFSMVLSWALDLAVAGVGFSLALVLAALLFVLQLHRYALLEV